MIDEIALDTLWRCGYFEAAPEARIDGYSLPLLADFQPRLIDGKLAWLEHSFDLPMQDECINYQLRIEAVPRNTQLVLNGRDFGEISGPFTLDVTDTVFLEDNLIAFRVFRGAAGTFGTVRLIAISCDS
jgi:hypothetical protein